MWLQEDTTGEISTLSENTRSSGSSLGCVEVSKKVSVFVTRYSMLHKSYRCHCSTYISDKWEPVRALTGVGSVFLHRQQRARGEGGGGGGGGGVGEFLHFPGIFFFGVFFGL